MAVTNILLATVRTRFPEISQISTDDLSSLLKNEETDDKILLLDVRERDECEVSQIPNAYNVIPNSDITPVINKIKDNRDSIKNIILYCSLGYRSCKFIRKVRSELSEDTDFDISTVEFLNLEGGIFKWANENKEIVDQLGKPTYYVHPYNMIWGNFLHPQKRRYHNNDMMGNVVT